MASRLEKLLFTVSLIDKASGPASKIAAQIDNITNRATAGMAKVAAGAAGLFATGYALKSVLGPAIEMDRAIGEVRSLGVRESALVSLEKTALKTSIALGENATEIVRSAYDIQSAIDGLTDNELSKFTQASAILAKGTKSDNATITDYMGTMYGIFENTADKIGKADWVQMLTGQTATAVQMFKTTGAEMAGAFSQLGSAAETSGISMSEQMAILGTLQSTMSGSQAGTKYNAFLSGVAKAQGKLGLSFTDSQGRMLGVVDILNKIRGKFGETLDESEKLHLKKAFGSDQAMAFITGLIGKTGGLADSIKTLGNVKGMDTASKMAKAMADPWERMDAAGKAVKTTFGRVLQPVLVPLLDMLTNGLTTVQGWAEKHKTLTKIIGIATLTIFGLVAAVSMFAIVGGVAQLAAAGWGTLMLVNVGILKLWRGAVATAKAVWFLFQMAMWGGSVAINALKLGFLSSLPAVWAFSAALLANPITWIVLGVVALVAAIAMAIVHWDKIKKAIMDFGPFKMLASYIGWIISLLNKVPGINISAGSGPSLNESSGGLGQTDSMRVGARDGGLNRASIVPVGGLQQSIANNNGTTIEKVEVNTTGGVNGYQLADELALAGG